MIEPSTPTSEALALMIDDESSARLLQRAASKADVQTMRELYAVRRSALEWSRFRARRRLKRSLANALDAWAKHLFRAPSTKELNVLRALVDAPACEAFDADVERLWSRVSAVPFEAAFDVGRARPGRPAIDLSERGAGTELLIAALRGFNVPMISLLVTTCGVDVIDMRQFGSVLAGAASPAHRHALRAALSAACARASRPPVVLLEWAILKGVGPAARTWVDAGLPVSARHVCHAIRSRRPALADALCFGGAASDGPSDDSEPSSAVGLSFECVKAALDVRRVDLALALLGRGAPISGAPNDHHLCDRVVAQWAEWLQRSGGRRAPAVDVAERMRARRPVRVHNSCLGAAAVDGAHRPEALKLENAHALLYRAYASRQPHAATHIHVRSVRALRAVAPWVGVEWAPLAHVHALFPTPFRARARAFALAAGRAGVPREAVVLVLATLAAQSCQPLNVAELSRCRDDDAAAALRPVTLSD